MTPLRAASARHGGKAAALGRALRAGLPVPDGFVLDPDEVDALAAEPGWTLPPGPWAVRSSCADEDGATSSFAGQFVTVLGVDGAHVSAAVLRVRDSARTASAAAYRSRLGLPGGARMAVVVQPMIHAKVSGVLFTRHPLTGAPELWIEAAWGLGEAVVAGLVTPDRHRLRRDGTPLEHHVGHKDVEVIEAGGGTVQRPVPEDRARAATLGPAQLAALVLLSRALDRAFDGDHDAEFSFDADDRLHLLQRRSITR